MPPFHRNTSEFFLVVDGTPDVMSDGEWRRCDTDTPVVWLTGWRPTGFERFFRDFSVPATEAQAQDRSMKDELVQRVARDGERYGLSLVR